MTFPWVPVSILTATVLKSFLFRGLDSRLCDSPTTPQPHYHMMGIDDAQARCEPEAACDAQPRARAWRMGSLGGIVPDYVIAGAAAGGCGTGAWRRAGRADSGVFL